MHTDTAPLQAKQVRYMPTIQLTKLKIRDQVTLFSAKIMMCLGLFKTKKMLNCAIHWTQRNNQSIPVEEALEFIYSRLDTQYIPLPKHTHTHITNTL